MLVRARACALACRSCGANHVALSPALAPGVWRGGAFLAVTVALGASNILRSGGGRGMDFWRNHAGARTLAKGLCLLAGRTADVVDSEEPCHGMPGRRVSISHHWPRMTPWGLACPRGHTRWRRGPAVEVQGFDFSPGVRANRRLAAGARFSWIASSMLKRMSP
jgi:hypothetical protein